MSSIQFVADTLDEIQVDYKYPSGKDALVVLDQNIENLANKMRSHGWDLTESYPFKKVKNLVMHNGDIMIEMTQQLASRKDLPIRIEVTENPIPDVDSKGGDSSSTEINWSERDRQQMLFMGGSTRFPAIARGISGTIKDIKQSIEEHKRKKYEKQLNNQLRGLQSTIQDQADRIDRELQILQDDLADRFDDLEKLQKDAKKEGLEANVNTKGIENMLDNIFEQTDNRIKRIKSLLKSLN